ncbi:hypothetical protein RE428_34690 [Marinobacter nanhaiticus D15-8W]|uniref:hypothetical protein n=1 Tax=Marinobacter nanhaiticus TaxID=1305740 RepID=UPI0012B54919|nr:hypothetical protein [Marinobacter nanhaiticus]BES72451.1 hypothetical protein RE428_34690 [Marinobacter nanhaiticus D15-8W]
MAPEVIGSRYVFTAVPEHLVLLPDNPSREFSDLQNPGSFRHANTPVIGVVDAFSDLFLTGKQDCFSA